MARRSSRKKTDYTPLLIAAGGLALASLLSGGLKANVQTPSIIFAPPDINLSFPGFELPGNLYSPGGAGNTTQNFTFNNPLEGATAPSIPSIPSVDTKSIIDPASQGVQDFFSSIGFGQISSPQVNVPPAGVLPFALAGGKVGLIESITGEVFQGGKTFLSTASPEVAVASTTAIQGLGFDITKTGLNLIKTSPKIATGFAAPLAEGAAIGGGTVLATAGLGISGAVTAASAAALKEQATPGTIAGFGASAGGLGFTGLTALGAIPAVAGLPGVVVGGGFVLAGITGGFLGNFINTDILGRGAVPTTHKGITPSKDAGGNVDNSPVLPPSSSSNKGKKKSSSNQSGKIDVGDSTGNAAIVQNLKYQQYQQASGNQYSPPAQSSLPLGGFFT